MSKKTTYILGIVLTIIIGMILQYFLCCTQCCSAKASDNPTKPDTPSAITPKIENATKNAFAISDPNGNFNTNSNENFNFKTSNFSILEPLAPGVGDGVIKLKDYLRANPTKTVDITGFYKSDETNTSVYPNLGLARANAVKNYLVLHGISAKQIDTYGMLNDGIIPDKKGTLFGPLKFGVVTHDNAEADAAAMATLEKDCQAIRDNPLVLHFKTGEAAISLTSAQRKKMADISHCVDKLGVKLQVVGHTDNTGNAATNQRLGLDRANFAKGYLVKNGILNSNIETASKGQTKPIADNATPEGRAQNRRTVITIN
jgi:outer membrane protein OmpA-like peptidoglycan-associated protein